MVLVKIFKFSFSLFFFKKGLNILFDHLQKRKQPFLDYKDDIIKKSKNFDFSKGVNPWFVKIFKYSLSLFFCKIGLNILFEFVLKKKQPFLDHKNDIKRKSKISHFSKRVNLWFWSKFSNFLSVCFSLK